MSINLTRILQQITGLNTFFQGSSAGRQVGVVLEDSATVTWTTDGQGNVQAIAAGSTLPTATGAGQVLTATGPGTTYTAQALPVGSATQGGIVEVDGTTIIANAGVISVAAAETGIELIQSQTVSGGAVTSVTFSAIPQTFNSLKLFITGSASTGEVVYAGFNGDFSTATYYWNTFTMSFSAGGSGTGGFGGTPGAPTGGINTNGGGIELNIYGYNTALTTKPYTSQSCAFDFTVNGGVWNSTAAITSLVLNLASSATFENGTVFSLYGVK